MNRKRKIVEQQRRNWAVMPPQSVGGEAARIVVHANVAIGTAASNEAAQSINSKSLKAE
jgi:hypothetical protein